MSSKLPFYLWIAILLISIAYLLTHIPKIKFSLPQKRPTPTNIPTTTPTPTKKPTLTPTKIPTQTPTIAPTKTPVTVDCYQLKITTGEFVSNKCYSYSVYTQLQSNLSRYRFAAFELKSAENTINIVCNCRNQQECDFFRSQCDQSKKDKAEAEADLAKYKSIINNLISQGH